MNQLILQKPVYPEKEYKKRSFPLYRAAISQLFGENAISWYREHGLDGHNGIDIPCPKGTPIFAAHDGKIIQADNVNDSGGMGVKLATHDSYQYKDKVARFWTVYWHFQRVDVSLNQFVKAGEQLGLGDNTGISTGSHLHFGLLPCYEINNYFYKLEPNNGYKGYINPLDFIVKNDIMEIIKLKDTKDQYLVNADKITKIPDGDTRNFIVGNFANYISDTNPREVSQDEFNSYKDVGDFPSKRLMETLRGVVSDIYLSE